MITEYEKKQKIDNVISKDNILLDFYSRTCGPCKMLDFVIKDINKTYNDNLNIIKIEFEEHTKLAEKYNVEGYPTLIMFKNGKEISRKSGLQQKPVIIEMIEEAKNV